MDTTQFWDHYETLGVPANADAAAIRHAFRTRVKEIHPDVAADKAGATETFLRVRQAYTVLSDPEQRARFDAARANHRARTGARERIHRRPTAEDARTATSGQEMPGGWRMPGGPMYPPPGGDTWTRYHRTLSVDDLLQRAMREMSAGRRAHARRDLTTVLSREPENPAALVLMGRLYHIEGKSGEWIRILEDELRKNPGQLALRLALDQARKVAAEGLSPRGFSEADQESRRRAYLAGGLIGGALSVAWGVFQTGRPFILWDFVPVPAPLVTGTMACALFAGWTMAATGFLEPLDEELFFRDAQNAPRRCRRRSEAPVGLTLPVFALLHYVLAIVLMAVLALTRGTVSRSQVIVSSSALGLAGLMSLAAPVAAGSIMFWCPGWLLFALFTGWLVGDFFR